MSTLLLAITLVLTASEPPPVAQRPAEQLLAAKDREIQQALDQPLAELLFEDAPLTRVLDELSERLKINLHVHWRDLCDQGIEPDTPVRVRLRDLPAGRGLMAVLEGASGDVRLGWEIRDGVLLVATRQWLDRDLVTRIYPVDDLLGPLVERYRRERAAGRPDEEVVQPLFQSPEDEAESRLLDLIVQSVEPDAWREMGGSGTIEFFEGTAAVRTSRTTHRQLQRFLADVRAATVNPARGADRAATAGAAPPIEKTRPRD